MHLRDGRSEQDRDARRLGEPCPVSPPGVGFRTPPFELITADVTEFAPGRDSSRETCRPDAKEHGGGLIPSRDLLVWDGPGRAGQMRAPREIDIVQRNAAPAPPARG